MKETRSVDVSAVKEESKELSLVGKPIVFDAETIIHADFGDYKEVITRGALDATDLTDVKLLYNHDTNRLPLARSGKTMSFTIEEDGLRMDALLPDTEEGKSIHKAIERGDVTGMSFGFKVAPDGSSYDAKTNVRTITNIEKVYEFSITPFPAYAQTSVEARNQIDTAKSEARMDMVNSAVIKLNAILYKGE